MATHLRALQEPDPLPPAQRLTPTEAVPIHIPAIQETNLAVLHFGQACWRPFGLVSLHLKRGPDVEMGGIQMSATTLLFLGSMIAIA